MKIKIGKYFTDFNEDVIRSTRKDKWISSTVKSLEWMKIDRETLIGKVTEVYDLVSGKTKEA